MIDRNIAAPTKRFQGSRPVTRSSWWRRARWHKFITNYYDARIMMNLFHNKLFLWSFGVRSVIYCELVFQAWRLNMKLQWSPKLFTPLAKFDLKMLSSKQQCHIWLLTTCSETFHSVERLVFLNNMLHWSHWNLKTFRYGLIVLSWLASSHNAQLPVHSELLCLSRDCPQTSCRELLFFTCWFD